MKRICLIVLMLTSIVAFAQNNGKSSNPHEVEKTTFSRSGEILYFNMDSVNANYVLAQILNSEIEEETNKGLAIFQNRHADFQKKYDQFQQNYRSGVLTESQIEEMQQQLTQEYDTIDEEYKLFSTELETKRDLASKQVSDSVYKAVKLINTERKASYIFAYYEGGNLIEVDPSKDITAELLEILNEPFNKKKQKNNRK